MVFPKQKIRGSFFIALVGLLASEPGHAGCESALSALVKKASWVLGPLKQLVEPLYERDPRIAFLKLGKEAASTEVIDNLTSPVMQQLIFSGKLKPGGETATALRQQLDSPNVLLGMLESAAGDKKLVENGGVKDILVELEHRFRVVTATLNVVHELKYGKKIVSDDRYAAELLSYSEQVLGELATTHPELIAVTAKVLELLSSKDGQNLNQSVAPSFSGIVERIHIDDAFYEAMPEKGNLQGIMNVLSTALAKRLEDMPIGISYSPAMLTSAVWLGDRHYVGSWFGFSSINDEGMNKIAKEVPLIQINFNTSAAKKKRLAINLDRSHKEIDLFFSEDERSCGFQSCGTFAPTILIKSGIPVVSPGYVFPESLVLSLALQRVLGSPQIKEIRMHLGGTKWLRSIPLTIIFTAHTAVGTIVEPTFWTLVLVSAAGAAGRTLIGYIHSDDSEDSCEVHEGPNGKIEVKNCRRDKRNKK